MKNETIEKVLETWFEVEVIRNKDLDLNVVIKHDVLRSQCTREYSKMKQKQSFKQFKVDYMNSVFEALMAYNGADERFERAILEQCDETIDYEANKEMNVLSKYVFKAVEGERKEKTDVVRVRVGKGEDRAKIVLNTYSLDYLSNDNDEISIVDLLSDESNVFNNNQNIKWHKSRFGKWFEENKHEILTKTQVKFIDDLNSINVYEVDNAEIERITGTKMNNVKAKLNAIAERTLKIWNKQMNEPMRGSTYHSSIPGEFVAIKNMMNSDDLDSMNEHIWEFIVENWDELEEKFIGKLITEEYQAINRDEYDTKLLYKIVDIVLAELNKVNHHSEHENVVAMHRKQSLRDKLIDVSEEGYYELLASGGLRKIEQDY